MSIPVRPEDLARTLGEYGAGYLLTASVDGRVKAVTVEVREVGAGSVRVVWASRGTVGNLQDNPAATLLFPPRTEHGYTLLVDGTATVVAGEAAGATDPDNTGTDAGTGAVTVPAAEAGFEVLVSGAVLHRPAAHAQGPVPDGPGACGHDCTPVGGT